MRPQQTLIDLVAARQPDVPTVTSEILASAEDHRLAPFVWRQTAAGTLVASEQQSRHMAMRYLASRSRNTAFLAAMLAVVKKLQVVGVEVATFKGVTTEARWFDSLGERPISDIDILVQPGAESRASEIIATLQPDHPLRYAATDLVTTGRVEAIAVRTADDVAVDIHFSLLSIGCSLRTEQQLWNRMILWPLDQETSIRILDPESALVHMLIHLNKDRFTFLLGYLDVIRLLAGEDNLDWAYIDRFVRAEGLGVLFYSSLKAIETDLGVLLPGETPPPEWRSRLWRWLWPPHVRLLGMEGYFRRRHRKLALPFLAKGRTIEGLGWLFRQLFPKRELAHYLYPDVKGPYLWRLLRGRSQRGLANRTAAGVPLSRTLD